MTEPFPNKVEHIAALISESAGLWISSSLQQNFQCKDTRQVIKYLLHSSIWQDQAQLGRSSPTDRSNCEIQWRTLYLHQPWQISAPMFLHKGRQHSSTDTDINVKWWRKKCHVQEFFSSRWILHIENCAT